MFENIEADPLGVVIANDPTLSMYSSGDIGGASDDATDDNASDDQTRVALQDGGNGELNGQQDHT